MTSTTSTTTPEADTEDSGPSWTDFLWVGFLYAVAVVPFTPLWTELADPEARTGRYRGVQRLLAEIGPWPVTLVFAALGTALLLMAVSNHRKAARKRAALAS